MAKRTPITDQQREEAWNLYTHKHYYVRAIAQEMNIPYQTALLLTTLREKGFKTYGEYKEHLAQQKGFKTTHEYKEHLAQQKGFKTTHEYQEHLAQQKGFKNLTEYKEHLAQQKGFKTTHEYQEHLAQQRSKRQANRELSDLIKSRLKKLKKTQNWLAEQIGVSIQAVTSYVQGKHIPKNETLDKLCTVLEVERKPRSLDELVH